MEYRGTLFMPDGVMYFADPMIAIKGYKRNELNEAKRRPGTPLGYGLGIIYEYMFEVQGAFGRCTQLAGG